MFLATNECGHLRTSLSASARLRPTVPLNSAYHNLAASLIAIIWRPLYTTVLVLMVWCVSGGGPRYRWSDPLAAET